MEVNSTPSETMENDSDTPQGNKLKVAPKNTYFLRSLILRTRNISTSDIASEMLTRTLGSWYPSILLPKESNGAPGITEEHGTLKMNAFLI